MQFWTCNRKNQHGGSQPVEDDQKKPRMVLNALREYYGASIGVSGERQKSLRLLQNENENESIAS